MTCIIHIKSLYCIINILIFKINTRKIIKRSKLWHEIRKQIPCQSLKNIIAKLINLIPKKNPAEFKKNEKDFSRNRKLPFPKLILFILNLTTSSKNEGVDIRATDFFKQARRSGLWLDAEAVHRSAVTNARKKITWQVFENILYDAVNLSYETYPSTQDDKWHNMVVFATDGSKYDLPASAELREQFDPNSGLDNRGKGHYPQCLVTTVYDVFRRIPVARSIAPLDTSEREEFLNLLPRLAKGQLLLFDRGYPSYEILLELQKRYSEGYYVFRSPALNTFPAVEEFIKSNKEEDIIFIKPSLKYLNKLVPAERIKLTPIKIRVIKLISPDGEVSVLLTNLFDADKFSKEEIRNLYFRRWEVESYYRDEKVTLEVEKFHSKSYNGIMQELFAAAIMSIIARLLIIIARDDDNSKAMPQFKHAVITFSKEIILLASGHPDVVINIFNELLDDIARVRYYKSKKIRKSQPRVCKKPVNKWATQKKMKMISS